MMENKNPAAEAQRSEYIPRPLEHDNVELEDGVDLLVERLASNFHDVWGQARARDGWGYGPQRDDERKLNPCMVYYNDLTEEQKQDDRDQAIEVLRFITSKGYKITRRKKPTMEQVQKAAWTDYGHDTEKLNYDATVYFGLFGTDYVEDKKKLESALRSFYASIHEMFGQKKAATKKNYSRHAHTRFAMLSPLETESERIAAAVAAGCGIVTYKVVRGGVTSESARVIGVEGDVVDEICDSSLFALALWDGIKDGSDRRMNSAVVRALKGSTQRLMELDMPDNITVFHLLTPSKQGDAGTADHKAYTVRTLHPYPLETGNSWFYRGGKSRGGKTDVYNHKRFERNVKKIAHFNKKIKLRRKSVLTSDNVGDLLPGLHGNTAADRDLLRHLYTDSISYAAQKKRDKMTLAMIITAVAGLGIYSILSDAPEGFLGLSLGTLAPVLSVLIIALLTAAMVIFMLQRRSGSHDEYVDFRLIAECLRVQTYWRATGVESSVRDEFGAKSKLDFEWARYILRSWALSDSFCSSAGRDFPEDTAREIIRIWFGREDKIKKNGEYTHENDNDKQDGATYKRLTGNVDQYGFTRKKSDSSFRKARRDSLLKTISIAAAYGLTVLVALLVIINAVTGDTAGIINYVILAAGLVQILVAGYNVYADTKDYERLANNNKWLSIEYQKAIIAGGIIDKEQYRELFRRMGCEAVRETCGWALEFSRKEPGAPIS